MKFKTSHLQHIHFNSFKNIGIMKVHPYLNFDGKAEEAFTFYKSVFGGEFLANMKMSEMPEGDKLPAEEQNRTMHIALPINQTLESLHLLGTVRCRHLQKMVLWHPMKKDSYIIRKRNIMRAFVPI